MLAMRNQRLSVMVAAVLLPLGIATIAWGGWNLNWIRQRNEFLAVQKSLIPYAVRRAPVTVPAPRSLSLFGEKGHLFVDVLIVIDRLEDFDPKYDWDSHPTLVRARQLFPEAEVNFGVMDEDSLARHNSEGARAVREAVAAVIRQFPR
jgi:hypothetical protein